MTLTYFCQIRICQANVNGDRSEEPARQLPRLAGFLFPSWFLSRKQLA
jgi:hypothetical protein